jgi:hypothetical protein
MKNAAASMFALLIVACTFASAASGQPSPQSSDTTSSGIKSDSASRPQIVTGRIVTLDTKSDLISVRASDTGKVHNLEVSKEMIGHLRRGQRVARNVFRQAGDED